MKEKTFKIFLLIIFLIILLLGIILLADNYRITGKASLLDGKQTLDPSCITGIKDFTTDPPSSCLSNEISMERKDNNGCITEIWCVERPAC